VSTKAQESTLFLRKATGLVRSWSVFDAFIYAFFSINLITLGLYIFSQMYYLEGGMLPALFISGLFIIFEWSSTQPDRGHAPRWRRLCLAEPHPGRRHRLCAGRYRLVVHPLAVGAPLRRHVAPALLHAAPGHPGRPDARAVVQPDAPGPLCHGRDHVRAGDLLHRHRHEVVLAHPKVLLLYRHRGPADRVCLLALWQPGFRSAGLEARAPALFGASADVYDATRGRRRRSGRDDASVGRLAGCRLSGHPLSGLFQPLAQLGSHPLRRSAGRHRLTSATSGAWAGR
jgi:hypothetical protein